MARVVRQNERDVHVTDHGKRAELPRAETEEVELVADVGCVAVGWEIQRAGEHTSVLARRRSCAGQRKTHVLFEILFKKLKK